MISIVDYGVGNIASVRNMLSKIGVDSQATSDTQTICNSSKLILPGVGSFNAAMQQLNDLNLTQTIRDFASTGKPLLGICLGAQLLLDSSEEGELSGLKLISGTCVKFKEGDLKVPHMGWGDVKFTKPHPLNTFDYDPRFYFVHSYHMKCDQPEDVLGVTQYGHEFTSAISYNNIMGVQFHPEKSHRFGMQLLKNFTDL
jgi:glutamine amidotransferase